MLERKKYEKRRPFSLEEKQLMLSKSNNRCSHCGKLIDVKSDFSVEHVIPISKGGTNDLSNLVALCKECNADKADKVVHPGQYYFYLKDEVKEELITRHDEYCARYSWFSLSNICREDSVLFYCDVQVGGIKVTRNTKKGYTHSGLVGRMPVIFQKCVYSDLDRVLDYMIKYNKKYDLPTKSLKYFISYYFHCGTLYMMMKTNGEIIGVSTLELMNYDEEGKSLTSLFISGLYIMYPRDTYLEIIETFINYVCWQYFDALDIDILPVTINLHCNKDLGSAEFKLKCNAFFNMGGSPDCVFTLKDCDTIYSRLLLIREGEELRSEGCTDFSRVFELSKENSSRWLSSESFGLSDDELRCYFLGFSDYLEKFYPNVDINDV